MKILLIIMISISSFAKLSITWLGITGVQISDGKTSLLFDPIVTRPSMTDILFFKGIKSDKALVSSWIKELNLKADGVFISHSHADHSLDAANFASILDTKTYGSETTKNINLSHDRNSKNHVIKHGDKIQIGDFNIEVIETNHSPLILGINFAQGEVKEPMDLPSSYYSFKEGKSFLFYITHPQGKVFFHPGAGTSKKITDYKQYPTDIMLIGIASRKSTKFQNEKIIEPTKPKVTIPMHFDNFFIPLEKGKKLEKLSRVDVDEFIENISKKTKLIIPSFGKEIDL